MEKNNYAGKFIVFEGLDGSGKSTQAGFVADFLKQNGKPARNAAHSAAGGDVVRTKEQTADSEAGRKIKRILKGEIISDSLELQKLFVQDRKEHLENQIVPALQSGKFVICERYGFSTMAYGCSDGLDIDLLAKMNDNFLLPDLTIIIDVSSDFCIKRIDARGEKELFEKKEKLTKVRECYKKIPEMFENIFTVDGEGSPDEVFEKIKPLLFKII